MQATKKIARVKTREESRREGKKEKIKEEDSCAVFEGARKSNQDAGSGAGEGSADAHENELQRFKVSPPRRRRPPHPCLPFFLFSRGTRPFSALIPRGPPASRLFRKDDRRKGNSVTPGDKFAWSRMESLLQPPRSAFARLLSRTSELTTTRRNGRICPSTL